MPVFPPIPAWSQAHPILVHFPIALLTTSLVSVAVYFFTSMQTLRDAG